MARQARRSRRLRPRSSAGRLRGGRRTTRAPRAPWWLPSDSATSRSSRHAHRQLGQAEVAGQPRRASGTPPGPPRAVRGGHHHEPATSRPGPGATARGPGPRPGGSRCGPEAARLHLDQHARPGARAAMASPSASRARVCQHATTGASIPDAPTLDGTEEVPPGTDLDGVSSRRHHRRHHRSHRRRCERPWPRARRRSSPRCRPARPPTRRSTARRVEPLSPPPCARRPDRGPRPDPAPHRRRRAPPPRRGAVPGPEPRRCAHRRPARSRQTNSAWRASSPRARWEKYPGLHAVHASTVDDQRSRRRRASWPRTAAGRSSAGLAPEVVGAGPRRRPRRATASRSPGVNS